MIHRIEKPPSCAAAMLAGVLVCASGAGAQVPEGYELVRVAAFGDYSRPDINNRREVIWHSADVPDVSDIYMFSNGIVRPLTDETYYDIQPRINDHGDYAYLVAEDFFGLVDVAWNIDGVQTVFDAMDAPNAHPDINNSGQVVWEDTFSDNASDQRVFLFDGERAIQISDNGISNQAPRINNGGDVAFVAVDVDTIGFPASIMLYRDGVTTALTDASRSRSGPRLNDSQMIVWRERDFTGLNDRIILWHKGVEQVFVDQEDVSSPSINNNGDISYITWNKSLELWEISLHMAQSGQTFLLPNLGVSHSGPPAGMNDCGEMTWRARPPGGGTADEVLFLLRRIGPQGDFDHTCHIDAWDYAILENCYTGDGNGPPDGLLADCTRADFDGDGDVDQDDVAAFHAAVTGPSTAVRDCEAIALCGS